MFLRPASCPSCGAPVPEASLGRAHATCTWCRATFGLDGRAVHRAAFRRSLEEAERAASAPAIVLRDRRYVLERELARSARSVVLLARVHVPTVERVVLKLARTDALVARERAVLTALAEASTPGHVHFATRVPQIVAAGTADVLGVPTPAIAFRARAGWLHTVAEAPLDARHLVWIWRRVLEVLGFAHRTGWVHRRIVPEHLVLAPREHGVLVVGWSGAERSAGPSAAREDLADLARVLRDLEGRSAGAPLPDPLARLVRSSVAGEHADAWELSDAVGHAARRAFGPPTFHPLALPPTN